jgi:Flp pilus assembly protein TadG
MKRLRSLPLPPRQAGSVALPFALMLPVLLGFVGLALDVSLLYTRGSELQHMADSAAVAAARALDGTMAGVTNAKNRARMAAVDNYYQFSTAQFTDLQSWSSSALFFSDSPGGSWVAADSVNSDAAAASLLYAKVDTAALSALSMNPGMVETAFLSAAGGAASVTPTAVAISGPTATQVLPLAICALSTTRFQGRLPGGTELVELGYRRGITYDLLNLNPAGPTPKNFLINPIDPAGSVSWATHFDATVLKPFFCSGTTALPNIAPNSQVNLAPLAGLDLHAWLNSRFDNSGSGCHRDAAPTDTNVKEFVYGAPLTWMTAAFGPGAQATYTVAGNALVTVAEVSAVPATGTVSITAGSYGPLWAYARPVHYLAGSSTGAGSPEVPFATTDWATLYPVTPVGATPAANANYKSSVPYITQFQSPTVAGNSVRERRVLNVPLLNCSAGAVGATGTILGVGKFFMTSKATATAIYGEFAGLQTGDKLTTSMALQQ